MKKKKQSYASQASTPANHRLIAFTIIRQTQAYIMNDKMAAAGAYGMATAGYGGAATAGKYGAAAAGECGVAAAGNGGAATARDKGAAAAGDKGAAAVGECGAAAAGKYGVAAAGIDGMAAAGAYGVAAARNGRAAAVGECGVAASRRKSSTGEQGLSTARGRHVKVKGGLGAILVIVEENEIGFKIKNWNSCVVDGEKIKADTWYQLNHDGEFIVDSEEDE